MSGKYYFHQLPKADLRIIVLGIVLFLSGLLPVVQYQKHEAAVRYLKNATLNNLGLKSGGSKQTMELFRRASELYDAHLKAGPRHFTSPTFAALPLLFLTVKRTSTVLSYLRSSTYRTLFISELNDDYYDYYLNF